MSPVHINLCPSPYQMIINENKLKLTSLNCLFNTNILAPSPSNVNIVLGTICRDNGGHNDTSKWLYPRGKGSCEKINVADIKEHKQMAMEIVFTFQVLDTIILPNCPEFKI